MDVIRRMFSGRVGGLLLCLMEVVVGVLLLINPVTFTGGIIITAGWLMVVLSVVTIVRYFVMKPDLAAKGQLLFQGLVIGMGGVLCITQHGWFLTAIPLLTVIYAGVLLLMAAMKVQQMADVLRLKSGRWYMPAISAALAVVLAVIILLNPFGATKAIWIFAGVSMILEGVMELLGAIFR